MSDKCDCCKDHVELYVEDREIVDNAVAELSDVVGKASALFAQELDAFVDNGHAKSSCSKYSYILLTTAMFEALHVHMEIAATIANAGEIADADMLRMFAQTLQSVRELCQQDDEQEAAAKAHSAGN